MALLWVNLAAHCAPGTAFGWLDGRLRLAAIIGATSGPLAYLGGAKLGAVSIPPFGESPWPLPALAIVWGIAEAHGGTVDVVSRPGEGATFRLLLPAAVEEPAEQES